MLLSSAAPPSGRTAAGRLDGVDVARAVALAGMLLAHFARSYGPGDPGWLQGLDGAADGRAAPLFCVLLGVGAGLLAGRGTPDRVFLRRGLVLFGLGVAVWPHVERVYLILPHYGVALASVPVLRRLPTRWLLGAAAVAFLVPSAVAATVADHGLRTAAQPRAYGELLDVGFLVRYLAWTGGYPLAGWVGFVLVGLWLARQRLADRSTQRRLLGAGAAVSFAQPLVAGALAALRGSGPGERAGASGLAAFLDASAHGNRTAWYVLASASAVAVLAACLALTGPGRPRPTPLVRLGQLALSAYLAHLVLGNAWVWNWQERARPSLVAQVGVVAAVLVAFAAAAGAWRARYRRGPVEELVRALSG